MQAALEGAREIGFTVISLTLSLIAVFIPLLFMTGLVGRMFREFALTLTIAVVDLGGRLADADADDVLAHAAPRRRRPARAGSRACFNGLVDWVVARLPPQRSMWVLRHERATLLVDRRDRWSSPSASTSSCPRASCRRRTPGSSRPSWRPGRRSPSPRWQRLQARGCRRDPRATRTSTASSPWSGVGALNPTPNAGHLKITLKPRDAAQGHGRRDHRPAAGAAAPACRA